MMKLPDKCPVCGGEIIIEQSDSGAGTVVYLLRVSSLFPGGGLRRNSGTS